MERRLVCIHGRSQHGKDPKTLRRVWAAGLNKGLTLADLPTIRADSIVFLYYGDLIKQEIDALSTRGIGDERLVGIAARSDGMLPGIGVAADDEVAQMQIELLGEVSRRAGRRCLLGSERPQEESWTICRDGRRFRTPSTG
jgi:hypothetical protein